MLVEADGFKLIIADPGKFIDEDKLENGISYIQQRDNVFKAVKNPLYGFITSYDKDVKKFWESGFGEQPYDPTKVYSLGHNLKDYPYPLEQLHNTMAYFKAIYDKYGTEACVLLMFNNETKEWRTLKVLQIGASAGSVTYIYPSNGPSKNKPKTKEIFEDKRLSKLQLKVWDKYQELYKEGFRIIGTIHSHGNMNAFHSGTDDNDEYNFDGLHITIGKVNSGWDFSQRWMFDRAEFKLEITAVTNTTYKEITDLPDITTEQDDLDLLIEQEKPTIINTKSGGSYHWSHWGNDVEAEMHDWEKWYESIKSEDQDKTKFDNPNEVIETEVGSVIDDDPGELPPIFPEKDFFRLRNKINGLYIWVSKGYYYANEAFFKNFELSTIRENEIPATRLINVPALNSKYPEGEKSMGAWANIKDKE